MNNEELIDSILADIKDEIKKQPFFRENYNNPDIFACLSLNRAILELVFRNISYFTNINLIKEDAKKEDIEGLLLVSILFLRCLKENVLDDVYSDIEYMIEMIKKEVPDFEEKIEKNYEMGSKN